MKYKLLMGILFTLLIIANTSIAQVYERSRQETRSFRVYNQTSLEVYNKYGNIHLFAWEKDSVKIDIDLTVKSSKESKADKVFEFIDFEFSNSKYYIIARTQLRQNQGSFWAELSELANTVFSGNTKTEINYNIYLPADISVRMENKFGNIYCTDHSGDFEVDLSNGDLRANNLTGETKLDLSFGNAGLNRVRNGILKANFLELDLAEADELKVESKSSTLRIGKADILKISSRRDKFYINELGAATGETSFSYLTVNGFINSLRITADYGEIKIKGINPSFQVIDIKSKYSDIVFQIANELSCFVDIEHTESTGIYFPDHYKGLSVLPYDKVEGEAITKGYIGSKELATGGIKITIQSGKVTFQDEIELF